jgi:replicative DNA helicase
VESRTPPHNLDAEKSVLGSILLDNDVFAALEGTLSAERFYKEGHRKIYRAMERLFRRSEPMDLVTLTEELRQAGDLEAVGSVPYLIGLADAVPTAAYAESYAKIVHEKAVLRDLIGASGRIMQTAFEQAAPLEQVLDEAESAIFDLATSKRRSFFEGMPLLVQETFQHINELFTNPDPVSGLRTGFKELDLMTAGLQPSTLNVLAARPSMGKCLGAGTRVLMYDGSVRPVEELQVGDLLMGPDSCPRHVRSLARGREMMYWVRQRHGIDYRVNESHVLSLVRCARGGRREVVNLSVRDWLGRSAAFKRACSGYKVAVDFAERSLDVAPYVLGAWLGGALDPVDDDELLDHLAAAGVRARQRVPHDYLTGSRRQRSELLAGLLEATGAILPAPGAGAQLDLPHAALARDVKFLADSLGYRTALSETADGTGPEGAAAVHRLRIEGDLSQVPLRRLSVPTTPVDADASWRLSAIAVEPDGVDAYYGFTLTGDGLFLLEDMTVTHNTAFALSILLNAALREKKTVGIFSLEMSSVQLVTRMLCSEARVDMSRVRSGQLSDRDFQRLADTAGRMSEARVYIDDNADLTVMELRSRTRRLMAEHDLGLVIVDYLQLMSGAGSRQSENRQQEISTISRGLKALARELDIPILVLSQLSRAVEARPNKRPMLSDLRECVTGDTLVVLADGGRVPIRTLVGRTPEVVAMSADGTLTTATSDAVWEVGRRPVYRVALAGAGSLTCTARHRLFTEDGWQRVGSLRVGTRVAVAPATAAAIAGTRTAVTAGTAGTTALERDARGAWSRDVDLSWVPVTAIDPAGEARVYDLTVPGPASWLADGIVSHNSGAIEQDADLVMFIYRDEYYDPHSEKQGIAEIIIGKQRNGPVGALELQFHNAHVRFNDLARGRGD